jgi:hypothetical protein
MRAFNVYAVHFKLTQSGITTRHIYHVLAHDDTDAKIKLEERFPNADRVEIECDPILVCRVDVVGV